MVDVADDGFQLTAELENVTEECSTDELADGMIQTEACNWGSPPTACSMDAVSDGGIFLDNGLEINNEGCENESMRQRNLSSMEGPARKLSKCEKGDTTTVSGLD